MPRFANPVPVPPRKRATAPAEPQRARLPRQPALAQTLQLRAAASARAASGGASGSGLPAGLKAGVEALSGLAMDDVKVHYGSGAPARIGAAAFARGNEIHVAPGQERHLPHEAWHVVQQKQGRVRATMQLRKQEINDDPALEAEADAMGTRAMGLPLSDEAPPPPARNAPGGSAAGPIQRTTIVIGYQEGDSMFNASLNEIDKPGPVHFFSNEGVLLPKGPESTMGLQLKMGDDTSKIHVVAHGSPGKLASVDLPTFLEKIREMKVFTKDVTDLRLGACYAMMREDIDDKSVAFEIAQWLQKHAQVDQQVKLVTGFTSNTGGEFAKGKESFEPLDTRAVIEAQHFALYLFYKTRDKLLKANAYKKSMYADLWSDCEEEESEVAEAIITLAPVKPWQDRSRTMAKEFAVTAKEIQGQHRLRPGYTIASVTKENFDDFPRRLIVFESLGSVRKDVEGVLSATIEKLYQKYLKEAQPTVFSTDRSDIVPTFGFSPNLESKPESQTSPTFGFAPSFGSQGQQPTNFTFTPTFAFTPTFGSQSEETSNTGFTPTFGLQNPSDQTSTKKEEKK